ncbi:hypothetical protein CLOSTASPAR_01022 [[Clostridium] asparagiforme DSM 15981]|uniref:Uncharacterized protein n=1 Tax=[Clostridium] asparagiforme DSM 15981 TaxID=518636 RepID=C0CVL9_9FIRM|nr:hypothetical protein CLOSTASPAR_01022 [[Clostridium] asparagiforme DSM 15981]
MRVILTGKGLAGAGNEVLAGESPPGSLGPRAAPGFVAVATQGTLEKCPGTCEHAPGPFPKAPCPARRRKKLRYFL